MDADRPAILITGAASGIGRATAELFAERGWLVGAFDISQSGIEALLEELGPDRCMGKTLDVREPAQWAAAAEAFTTASGGRMDLLFNNAGIGAAGWFEDIPHAVAQEMVAVNLMGAINGIYACREILGSTPGARIVNNGSVLALQGPPFGAVYGATKAALLSLSESLELEMARDGIAVTVLLPAQVDTPLIDRPSFSAIEGSLRDGPLTPPRDVAEAVWQTTLSHRIYRPVGRGSGLYLRLIRWVPGFMRWVTRRWLRSRTSD
jgi:NAD(P)-dependent dehydrogenase (short-subunit alcohol dehydrogenase family)